MFQEQLPDSQAGSSVDMLPTSSVTHIRSYSRKSWVMIWRAQLECLEPMRENTRMSRPVRIAISVVLGLTGWCVVMSYYYGLHNWTHWLPMGILVTAIVTRINFPRRN